MFIKWTLPPTTSSKVTLPFRSGTSKLNFTPATGLAKKRYDRSHVKISFVKSSPSPISESHDNEQEINTSPPLQIINPQPAASKEKRDLNYGRPFINVEPSIGRLLQNGLLFQQNFTIRSFEIGSDSRISIQGLMNCLQDTSLNHLKSVGILADGFGSTSAMTVKDLIWVVCWSLVEVDYYPSWGDIVQVDSWMYSSGRNGIHRDWLIRDLKTGKTLIRATSLFAMMNKKTRKLAKLSREVVVAELKPHLMYFDRTINKNSRKFLKLDTDNADYIRTSLKPGWTDVDVNQHVSHVKLINYVLEGVPRSVVESHELCAMTLEYRKECNVDSVLQSLSKISSKHSIEQNRDIELDHSLKLEFGPELVRGRTRWRKKSSRRDNS